jgi:hypothetical protein
VADDIPHLLKFSERLDLTEGTAYEIGIAVEQALDEKLSVAQRK